MFVAGDVRALAFFWWLQLCLYSNPIPYQVALRLCESVKDVVSGNYIYMYIRTQYNTRRPCESVKDVVSGKGEG